jgi:hypothetical protein
VEELDVRTIFQLYSRILKCNSLNWDKNYMLLTKDKRLMTMQYQYREHSFLRNGTSYSLGDRMNRLGEENFDHMPADKLYKVCQTQDATCEAYYGKSVKLKF